MRTNGKCQPCSWLDETMTDGWDSPREEGLMGHLYMGQLRGNMEMGEEQYQ